jgi:aspartate/methionine/tyrosine aminotransferase
MRDWVFRDTIGRYTIDFGASHAPFLRVGDLPHIPNVALDYGNDRGHERLREQVANLYGRSVEEVGVTHGAQEALYLLYRTLFNSGDHLIAFRPAWEQLWRAPEAVGCTVTALPYTDDFRVDLTAISASIKPSTRAVVVNTPCNPTGTALSTSEREALIQLVRRHNLFLIADEEYLVDFRESLVCHDRRVVSVSGLSKVFGAPGLRTGWLCGDRDIVARAMDYKHMTTISNSTACEHLAAHLLDQREQRVEQYRALLAKGAELVEQWADTCRDHLSVLSPEGTPFCWIRFKGAESSLNLCRRLLHNTGVRTMPAEVFGETYGMRLTFARPIDELREGLNRIRSQLADPA